MKKFHPLRVAEVRRETAQAVSVRFDVPDALKETFRYVQGQHLTIKRVIDGEELRRCYSVCAPAQDQTLRIAVKAIDEGKFSGWVNRHLKAGEVLDVFPPIGSFFTELNPDQSAFYVAFAGGSGITPVLSLVATTLRAEPKSRFLLAYGNRDAPSVIFLEELAALKDRYLDRFQLLHVLESDEEGDALTSGLLDETRCGRILDAFLDPAAVAAFFICGPGPMMDAAERALQLRGVAPERIHIERFISGPVSPATPRRSSAERRPDALARVAVVIDGRKTSFDFLPEDLSILDAARAAGADAPFACKGGVCCTCRAKLLEGQAEMAKNYGLEPQEVAAGYVLTCQARPTTPEVVVSYDA